MKKEGYNRLSRRERQIMDIIYTHGEATALDVRNELPDPPSYSAVRALLRILEEKGQLIHKEDGPRYVFMPTLPRDEARKSVLTHILKTFFDGSTEKAMAAILDISDAPLSEDEYKRLKDLIARSRLKGDD